jgi:hypothetical protein
MPEEKNDYKLDHTNCDNDVSSSVLRHRLLACGDLGQPLLVRLPHHGLCEQVAAQPPEQVLFGSILCHLVSVRCHCRAALRNADAIQILEKVKPVIIIWRILLGIEKRGSVGMISI